MKVVDSVYASHGVIYVKKLDGAVLRVNSLEELNDISKVILNPESAI